jgi:hypothetical protein
MKNLLTLLLFAVAVAFPQRMIMSGQGGSSVKVWWGSSTDSSLKIMHRGGFVYYDSASLNTNWKRIDNTSDSCSRPFAIASEGTYPVWKYELEGRVRAVNATSNAAVYRVETRYVKDPIKQTYWGWRRVRMLTGYTDVSVQDSTVFPHTGVTTKSTLGGLFFVTGDQARICTDNASGTSTAAGDSVKTDTLIVRRQ